MINVTTLQKTKFYNLLTLIFIFCLLISNIAEVKIMDVFGLAQVGAGTIFFPLLYILNDIITEVYGFSASRKTIWIALLFSLTFTLLIQLILVLPDGDNWQEKEAFETVFILSPQIVIASLSSYFLGELINSSILSALKFHFNGEMFAVRAIFSTLISSLLESIIFGIIVFYGNIAFYGRIPDDELIKMAVMLTIMKVLYEIITLPISQALVNYLKKSEQLDVYEKPSFKKILPNW